MQYTKIDSTDLVVSRLAFGTASLHRIFRQSRRLQLLDAAFDSGITHFDTSPYYGHGLAESDLGLFVRGRRDAVSVATKVGLYAPEMATGALSLWGRKAAGRLCGRLSRPRVGWSIREAACSLRGSLRRLRTDHVDILFLHEPEPALIDTDEFLAWLENQRSKGIIRYWGLAGIAERFCEWLRHNHPLAAVVQAKDSLDRREADPVLKQGRPLQFTYGYLSSYSGRDAKGAAESVLRDALLRNRSGAIVFSTRRPERVKRLTGLLP